jgi:hypothetical protein
MQSDIHNRLLPMQSTTTYNTGTRFIMGKEYGTRLYAVNARSVRKPRTRWEDVGQRDALQGLGIREWARPAGDKEEWRHLLREARAQKWL